jgi:transcriptional regulator with XRE-family HTH domain
MNNDEKFAAKLLSEKSGVVPLRHIFVEARNRLGLNQGDVARACGITQGAISQFESSMTGLNLEVLEKIRSYLVGVAIERETKNEDGPILAIAGESPLSQYARLQGYTRAQNFLNEVERDLRARLDKEREITEARKAEEKAEKNLVEYVASIEKKAQQYDTLAAEVTELRAQVAKLSAKKSPSRKIRIKRK